MPDEAMRLSMIGKFDPQPLEQVVDREIDLFRADAAGLELIDVEERVQHAQQSVRRLVEPGDQHQGLFVLFVLDLLRQDSAHQAESLQRLPQVMAGGGKEARFAEIGALCVPFGALQRRLRTLALGDVIDRHHDLAGALRFPADLLGTQQQHTSAERRQFDLDLIILDGGVVGLEQIEQSRGAPAHPSGGRQRQRGAGQSSPPA